MNRLPPVSAAAEFRARVEAQNKAYEKAEWGSLIFRLTLLVVIAVPIVVALLLPKGS